MSIDFQFVNHRFKITMQDGSSCYWEFTQHEFIDNKIYWCLIDKDGKTIDSILIEKTRAMKILKRTKKMLEYKVKKLRK